MEIPASQAQELRAIVDEYISAYNSFDLERMFGVLSDTVKFENYSGGALTAQADGLAEFRQLAHESKGIFAEREQRVTHWDVSAAGIKVDIAYRGKLAQDIPGGPSAGTILDLAGTSEFAFEDGKISRIVDRA